MISTISCLLVAGVALSAWSWRGPVAPAGRELAGREQKKPSATMREASVEPAATKVDQPKVDQPKVGQPKVGQPSAGGTASNTAPPKVAAPASTAAPPAAAGVPPAPAPTAPPPTRAGNDRAAAAGETGATPTPTGPVPAPSPPRSTDLVPPPSLYETGRIGKAAVNEPGVPSQRAGERDVPAEMLVKAKPSDRRDGATPASYTGVIDKVVLDREIAPRFRLLGDCKADVAHRRRVAASSITGSHLLLRWTILPNGRVTDTQVVATAPADPRLVDCVKERMSSWSFRPGQGGATRVERKFSFR